jgi:hypothetical protein
MWYSIIGNIVNLKADLHDIFGVEAAKLAVLNIINTYPPPYYLMVSGGVDSQAMLYAWHLFGKNYIPTSIIYDEIAQFNQHDLQTLKLFSKKFNIEINYEYFDLLKFYKDQYDTTANKYECSSPHFCTHIKMSEKFKGTVIFSGNFLTQSGFPYNKAQHALTIYSYERPCVPFFFLSHPQLAYTGIFLKDTKKRNLVSSFRESYEYKVKYYQNLGFPVISQECKLAGFEKVKDYYDEYFWDLVTPKMRLKYNSRPSKRTYDLLLRYPYEEKFGETKYIFLLND